MDDGQARGGLERVRRGCQSWNVVSDAHAAPTSTARQDGPRPLAVPRTRSGVVWSALRAAKGGLLAGGLRPPPPAPSPPPPPAALPVSGHEC